MKIGNDIYYVGVNDHQIDLFEGQYVVPNGMSYNSYVIMDEKIAVMDTVDEAFGEECSQSPGRCETGLSGSTAYGAGSCRKYRELHESIS